MWWRARAVQQLLCLVSLVLCVQEALAQVSAASHACPFTAANMDASSRPSQEQVAQLADVCESNAYFHALHGSQLLESGRAQDAVIALEKALLLQPDMPGVQLDYAFALFQSGQTALARAVSEPILGRADLPQALRETLLTAAAKPTQAGNHEHQLPDALPWQVNGLVQLNFGHESNINSATSSQELTLALPNGSITLPLADTEKPVAADTMQRHLRLQAQTQWQAVELRLRAAYSDKLPSNNTEAENKSTELGAMAGMRLGPVTVLAGVAGQELWATRQIAVMGSESQLRLESISTPGNCLFAVQAGRNEQRYLSSGLYDGRLAQTRLEVVCMMRHGGRASATWGQATDTAVDNNRPGGNRGRSELYVRYDQPVGSGDWSVWARQTETKDAQAYSALLGSLVVNTRSSVLGVSYWHALGSGWSAGGEIESTEQTSNYALQNLQNHSAYLGLRWHF